LEKREGRRWERAPETGKGAAGSRRQKIDRAGCKREHALARGWRGAGENMRQRLEGRRCEQEPEVGRGLRPFLSMVPVVFSFDSCDRT
jgi:hypothetical protein